MREAEIEKYLVKRVAEHDGVAEKFVSPGCKNKPDRIVSWPARAWAMGPLYAMPRVHFVEVKTLLGKVTIGQKRDHERRRKMGFVVVVVRSKADVDTYIKRYAPPRTV